MNSIKCRHIFEHFTTLQSESPKCFQAFGDFFDYAADIRRSYETWKHLPAVDSNRSACCAE